MVPKFPARVHVILARQADSGIVIRRGPSASVCTVGWNRKHDTFQLGQWMRGRIYERRCDLSPDGRYLIYFASNWNRMHRKVKGSWTAISRTPHLKAIGLWANGSAWGGGGLFMSNHTFWLNTFMVSHEELMKPEYPDRTEVFPFHEGYGGECPGVYYIRLQRDGWRLMPSEEKKKGDGCMLFEKLLPKGWALEKTAHETLHHPPGKGCYYDTHRLLHAERGMALDFPGWEWADWDRHRLAWIEKGVLFAAKITAKGLGFVKELHDFNPMEFEAIKAPY